MNNSIYDVVVVGAGSGGIGAAIGAARMGVRVLLVDRAPSIGGVVAFAWVHNWEPTCGNSPLTREIWERMRSMPLGAADMPFTTSRYGSDGLRNPTMPFELWAYRNAVQDIVAELPNLEFWNDTVFAEAVVTGRRIEAVRLLRDATPCFIYARSFIDSTGTLAVARSCGCATMLGTDSRYDFNEESAPEAADRNNLNLVNWIYRVSTGASPCLSMREEEDIPDNARISSVFTAEMPCGDILVNICGHGSFSPEIPGDRARADREEFSRAYYSYCWQVVSGLHPDWRLVGMAPELGIRESYRLRARKVLTLNDVIAGGGPPRSFIAMTDHPIDVHGTDLATRLGPVAYGIPYETTLPQEFDNLWVASRGIGTTHIVGGSCRLSRTMLTLGEAVGKAAAISAMDAVLSDAVIPSEIADFEML